MKIKKVLLVFLIIFSGIFPARAATDEGYGEDQTSLGQFVDSFEDSGNISTAVNVIRNATFEAMELNFTEGGMEKDYENFTTYTEVDTAGDLDLYVLSINWTTMRRDSDSHAWYDYGVNYFGDFEGEFTIIIDDIEAGDSSNIAIMWIIAIANENGGRAGLSNGILLELQQQGSIDDTFKLRFLQVTGGALDFDVYGASFWGLGTYYMRLNRTGTDAYLWMYSDSARTILIDSASSASANTTAYRYVDATIGYDVGGADETDHSSGSIDRLWFGDYAGGAGSYESLGYFTTVDYLSDPLANGSALVQMTNTTIPANTAITMEFSEDNSTWIFNDWQPIFGGFESVDLRDLDYSAGYYVRFNLSTTDPAATPRVYQSRLITTIGNVSAPIVQKVTGSWIEYNATAISAIIGTVDAGDLNSTFVIDGDMFNVSETVGTPGMLISINFTDVDPAAESLWILVYGKYDGNLNHDFDIEVWNFEDSAWVEDSHIPDMVAFGWINSTIYPIRIPNEFLKDGEVRVRLDHEAAGNMNHDIFIEYIRLQAFIPLESEAEIFQFFWIVIAIALMLLAIMLSKMWFEEGDP